MRAIDYRIAPTEVYGRKTLPGRVCSPPFTGEIQKDWPNNGRLSPRGIYLSCGDSADSGIGDESVDLVVTDPPFFDNVHYSELADFFFAWQQLAPDAETGRYGTTRNAAEVQDTDADCFASKLQGVFRECRRILKNQGLLVFTYHHSRDEGWKALAEAVLGAGFAVVNSQPVKAEMSVATPKSQAKEPIQLDIIIVCRKDDSQEHCRPLSVSQAVVAARSKLDRLAQEGFDLSRNDRKIVLYGQLLATLRDPADLGRISDRVLTEFDSFEPTARRGHQQQQLLFDDG